MRETQKSVGNASENAADHKPATLARHPNMSTMCGSAKVKKMPEAMPSTRKKPDIMPTIWDLDWSTRLR